MLSSLVVLFLLTCTALVQSSPPNIIIVGGSSGMGKAAAIATVRSGGRALLVSRSTERLDRAAKEVMSAADIANGDGSKVSTYSLDVTDEDAVKRFGESLSSNEWDALVVSSAGRAPHGPIGDLSISEAKQLMESKFWGAVHCSKYIGVKLRDGGYLEFWVVDRA